MNKFLFICKERKTSYGISFGLFNSARFVSESIKEMSDFESKVIFVKDMNEIDKFVTEYNPTHVFIEALWVTKEKFLQLFKYKRHIERKWIIRIHSKGPFLANEGNAFGWMNDYIELGKEYPLYISVNNLEFSIDLNKIDYKNIYLPNIYFPKFDNFCKIKDKEHFDIGCFGAIRPMKNHLQQAIAAIRFANDKKLNLRFHINGNRLEQNGDKVLSNLRSLFNNSKYELVEHDWMNHEKFINVIRQMDMGLQISFSESFNIVTADFVANNIPIVVSKDFNWLPFWIKSSCTDTDEILNKMNLIYHLPIVNILNKTYLKGYNIRANCIWNNYIHGKL